MQMQNRNYRSGIIGLFLSLITPVIIWIPYFTSWDWMDNLSSGPFFLLLFLSYLCAIFAFVHGLFKAWNLGRKSIKTPGLILFVLEWLISGISILAAIWFIVHNHILYYL